MVTVTENFMYKAVAKKKINEFTLGADTAAFNQAFKMYKLEVMFLFFESSNIMEINHCGFRSGRSTLDHMV